MKLSVVLIVVGVVQIVLGLGYLFFPQQLLHAMGHSAPPVDINYPLGMLAARFLMYGIVFVSIAKKPYENRLWIGAMVCIQLLDLAVGIYYTAMGVVAISLSGFPMFNAMWIALVLWLWRPKQALNS